MRKKVLHVYPQLNCGGTEMVIFNLIKYGNHKKYQFDILAQRQGDNEDIFRKIGCRIYYIPNSKKYSNDLFTHFESQKYDIVHVHTHRELGIVLKVSKKAHIKCRIAHSHSARLDLKRVLWPIRVPFNHKYEKYATDLFGCSSLALKWLFPLRWKYGKIIYNGIDLDLFRFSNNFRNAKRAELGLDAKRHIFLNVGRCVVEKNQRFILQLARCKEQLNNLFIIIGDGPLYNSLKEDIEKNNLKNVMLLGKRSDVQEWLFAADGFIFPSIYEGLGIVAIEAQSSGLPVVATDNLPTEVDMGLGLLQRLPLSDLNSWNHAINNSILSVVEREAKSKEAVKSNYNIYNVTKFVESIYEERCK